MNDEFLNFKTKHVGSFDLLRNVASFESRVPSINPNFISKSGRTFVVDFISSARNWTSYYLIYLIYFSRSWKIFFSRANTRIIQRSSSSKKEKKKKIQQDLPCDLLNKTSALAQCRSLIITNEIETFLIPLSPIWQFNQRKVWATVELEDFGRKFQSSRKGGIFREKNLRGRGSKVYPIDCDPPIMIKNSEESE